MGKGGGDYSRGLALYFSKCLKGLEIVKQMKEECHRTFALLAKYYLHIWWHRVIRPKAEYAKFCEACHGTISATAE